MPERAGNFEFESVESILERAFAPVEPPEHLYVQFEARLEQISANAIDEIADWELAAMRDPRNWARPAVAVAAGAGAAGALLVLGLRSRRKGDDKGVAAVKALSDALTEAAADARKEVENAARNIGK
jgi:hypothetical protein